MKTVPILLSTKLNKILFAVVVFGILMAITAPFLLSSPECATGVAQQQRHNSGCIIGADFGPGFGIIFGLVSATIALALALILESTWFNKLSFLTKFFLLIPIVLPLLYSLVVLFGLVSFMLQK